MKKLMVYRIVSVVLLLTSAALCIGWYTSYRQAAALEEQLAQKNLDHWANLCQMTYSGQAKGSVEDIKEQALYQNGILFCTAQDLSPAFNHGHSNFLTISYDSFAQDLGRGKFQGGELEQEALDVYQDMNEEINEICTYVMENAGEDESADLLDSESVLYRQVQEKIQAFCDKYDEKLEKFNDYSRHNQE